MSHTPSRDKPALSDRLRSDRGHCLALIWSEASLFTHMHARLHTHTHAGADSVPLVAWAQLVQLRSSSCSCHPNQMMHNPLFSELGHSIFITGSRTHKKRKERRTRLSKSGSQRAPEPERQSELEEKKRGGKTTAWTLHRRAQSA